MKTIVFLADSVNRRFLEMYGRGEALTPNLKRLSQKSCIFDNHWTGSSPCMPARRDLFTGRLNFLERHWGGIEPYDQTFPDLLEEEGIRSHIETDHYHYLELGGEGYCQSFTTWRMYRGQENDNMEWMKPGTSLPQRRGRIREFYEKNREEFKKEADYPSPQTYQASAKWLKEHGGEEDYLLLVEGFDPHEPFDVPADYLELYKDDYTGEPSEWPEYAPFDGTKEELAHLRNRYAALLTLSDCWLGKVLDVCDELNLWDDAMIIFTTDHGYMLGEHGLMAKNYMQAYNEVFHIPLFIHTPGQKESRRIDALTQNIDLFPTIAAHNKIDETRFRNPIHGQNLLPLMEGTIDKVREALIYGVFGKSVNVYDGKYTFFKCPETERNVPLNLYTAMLTSFKHYIGPKSVSDIQAIETGRFLKWTDFPVYKIPAEKFENKDKTQRFSGRNHYNGQDFLFDIESDYAQNHNLTDSAIRKRMVEILKETMERHDSPIEQFERLGI